MAARQPGFLHAKLEKNELLTLNPAPRFKIEGCILLTSYDYGPSPSGGPSFGGLGFKGSGFKV